MIDKLEYINTFITLLTLLIGGVSGFIIAIAKNKNEIKAVLPKRLKDCNNVNKEIYNKLEELKEMVNADRVQLYDFHNGEHYANGRSALKMSCTFEVRKPDILDNQRHMQNIPLACYSNFLGELFEFNKVEISLVDDIKYSMPATYQLLNTQGVQSCYNVILTNKCNDPIGYICVQYIRSRHKLTNCDWKTLENTQRFIESDLESLI